MLVLKSMKTYSKKSKINMILDSIHKSRNMLKMLMKLSKKDSKKVQKAKVWNNKKILTQMIEENNNSQD